MPRLLIPCSGDPLKGRKIWHIGLSTIDNFEGGEKPCVIENPSKRAINAMFVIVDVDAVKSEISLSAALKSKDELDQDIQGIDIERLNQAQKYLKKIIEYFIAEGCVKPVDIKQLFFKYISFDQSNEFAVEQLKVK
ncbi:hypothetical protein MMC22_004775 [Lobaria immixta]|nr:hypothetical protein [Lobaria immixta]